MNDSQEKIKSIIFTDSKKASAKIAQEIAGLITQRHEKKEMVVLGLATGSTPMKVYEELVRMHKEDQLSFQNVITFNLDEYYPIHPSSLQSYVRFMNENLFDHIDIKKENINIPDGQIEVKGIDKYCKSYESKIDSVGGIDIQLLGIGRTGHIGFNEPGSSMQSSTRLITLDSITRVDAASDFFGQENVPRTAITMGIGTILKSKKILLMAWGEGKAPVVQRTIEGEVSEKIPATYLQNHNNTVAILDEAAAAELKRIKTPWLLGSVSWDRKTVKKAVVWLSQKLNKPILKLIDEEYNENGLGELVAQHGSAYEINLQIFNDLQHTITGWPGGKPDADDSQRPERAKPFPKRVLIFSPHPDDDVISMGGTVLRLVKQNHEVHVAYQTSGNIAVFDDYAYSFLEFADLLNKDLGKNKDSLNQVKADVYKFLKNKKSGQIDSEELQYIKGLIRKTEAISASRFNGLNDKNIHFLDMPFYETGRVKKSELGAADIEIVKKLMEDIRPHQIYAAGDLSDPHGTHRVCLNAIIKAVELLRNEDWLNDCRVWLYRGAWQEWGVGEIEMAVPLSPEELMKKRRAIFKHRSQKDTALFPGHDNREFWQRAEDRNRMTANIYNALGLSEYEAMEAFVEWKGN
jgi:glucosamine-6-phosphate deaminase